MKSEVSTSAGVMFGYILTRAGRFYIFSRRTTCLAQSKMYSLDARVKVAIGFYSKAVSSEKTELVTTAKACYVCVNHLSEALCF